MIVLKNSVVNRVLNEYLSLLVIKIFTEETQGISLISHMFVLRDGRASIILDRICSKMLYLFVYRRYIVVVCLCVWICRMGYMIVILNFV